MQSLRFSGKRVAGEGSGLRSSLRKFACAAVLLTALGIPVVAVAILPAIVGVALLAGASPEIVISTLAASLSLGALVAFVNFSGTSSTGNAPLHVQLVTDAPLPTPAGWTAPTSGTAGEPTPPASASAASIWQISGTGSFSSASAACTNWLTTSYQPLCTTYGIGPCSVQTLGSGSAGTCQGIRGDGSNGGVENWNTSVTCPAGYTSSSGSCVLSNATLVQKPTDSRCGIKRVGNTFTADGRDGDCGALPNGVMVGTGYVSVTEADGTSVMVTIDSSTGRATAISDTPLSGGGTQRTTTSFGTAIGGSVPVAGQKTEQFSGSGDLVGGTPIAGTGTCGGPGQPACKIDESGTPTGAGALDVAGTALDTAAMAREAMVTGLSGAAKVNTLGFVWSPELPGGVCETVPFGVRTWSIEWDWCGPLGTARAMWGWMIAMLAGLYVWRSGTAAVSGGK